MQVTIGIPRHDETVLSHVLEECIDLFGIFLREILGIQSTPDPIPFAETSRVMPPEDFRVLPFQALNKSLRDRSMLRNVFQVSSPLNVPIARPDLIEDEVAIVVELAFDVLRIDPNGLGRIGEGAEAAPVAPEESRFSPYDPEAVQTIIVLRKDELMPHAGKTVKEVAQTRMESPPLDMPIRRHVLHYAASRFA